MLRGFRVRWNRRVDVERHVQPTQIDRRGEAFRLLVGLGADKERAHHGAWRLFAPGTETLLVSACHLVAAARIDEVRERER